MESTEAIGRKIATGDKHPEILDQKSLIVELFAGQSDGLKQIESRISQSLGSDADLLTEISSYLLSLGGKRIRPLLALLSSSLFGEKSPSKQLVEAASGIELIHMATLLHDDIIDNSMIRRNSESAFSKFGMTPTLLTGDFLLVKAFGMCARLDQFVINRTEKACIELTEGELLEGHLNLERNVSFEEYRVIIEKKTSALFSLACVVGAHFAGASEEDIETINKFGNEAGVLFQMVDDVLDVTANKDLLGKPAGIDLVQKTPTLPNILWLASGDSEASKHFNLANPSEADAKLAIEVIRKSSVLDDCMKIITDSQNESIRLLQSLESKNLDSLIAEQLESLLEYTISRIPLS